MMIKTVIKSSACVFFSAYLLPIGCLQRVARVRKDHPGGYRQIFFFFNFPRISNRSAEPLDGIQNGAGGRRGERSLETKPAALKHTELAD